MSCLYSKRRSDSKHKGMLVLQVCGFPLKRGKGPGSRNLQMAKEDYKVKREFVRFLMRKGCLKAFFFHIENVFLTIESAIIS